MSFSYKINVLPDMLRLSNLILFRVDANPSIGFGYIMRCLSTADAVTSFKQEVLFILVDDTI